MEVVRNSGENVSLVIVPDAGHVCNVDNKNFFLIFLDLVYK